MRGYCVISTGLSGSGDSDIVKRQADFPVRLYEKIHYFTERYETFECKQIHLVSSTTTRLE